MGLFDKIIEACTEPADYKTRRKGFLDRLYEACTEPVGSNKTEEDEEELEETDISFTDSQSVEQVYKSIKMKLQIKRRELKTIGKSIESINFENFPSNKKIQIEDLIKEYNKLCQSLENVASECSTFVRKDMTKRMQYEDTLRNMNLDSIYNQFEIEYEEKIPQINNLYWLSELKKQNHNMEIEFRRTIPEHLTEDKIESYKRYIQAISAQREKFTYELGDEIIDELVTSEYRLRMLDLMKDIFEGRDVRVSPFQRESQTKKDKYEELLLEDLKITGKEYNELERKVMHGKIKIHDKQYMQNLRELSQDVQESIDLAMVDDLSISELFTEEQFETLQKFIILRGNINQIFLDKGRLDYSFVNYTGQSGEDYWNR